MSEEAIVDSHFHLWEASKLIDSPVLSAPQLRHDVTWDDFMALTRPSGVDEVMFVHAQGEAEGADELSFANRLAEEHPEVTSYVAFAPVERSDLQAHLDALAREPLVRGIRRATQYEEDPAFCARRDYVEGIHRVADGGFVADVCVLEHQYDGLISLAEQAPEATIVLEHLGKPRLDAEPSAHWRDRMDRMAELPNLHCKISPTIFGAADPPVDGDRALAYVAYLLAAWGWDRVMFASNWPVSTVVVGYTSWLELVRHAARDATPEERRKLFADNARRVYGPR